MHATRDVVVAGLRVISFGDGQRFESIARTALPPVERRDPFVIVGAIGYLPRAIMSLRPAVTEEQIAERDELEPRCSVDRGDRIIAYRCDDDERERGLNLLFGIASIYATSRADIIKLAGYIAMPHRIDAKRAVAMQPYLPEWYVAAHCRMRALGSESGLRLVVGGRG